MQDIFSNEALGASIIAWALAQLAKAAIPLFNGKGFQARLLIGSGGMPSSHSAFVSGLAAAVAMIEGANSIGFAIAAVFALVVMYDAAGVRRAVSQQAAILNRIVQELKLKRPLTEMGVELRELVGHTPFQVIIGGAMGIAVAWVWVLVLKHQ